MRVVKQTPAYVILDDFLPQREFDLLWEFVHSSRFYRDPEWQRVWDLVDEKPWRSEIFRWDGQRTGLALDFFWDKLISSTFYRENFNSNFNSECYLHPPGSSLDWHHDANEYVGAYAFYTHKNWHTSWGGELLIIEDEISTDLLPDREHIENGKLQVVKGTMDGIHRQDLSKVLMDHAVNTQFVFPKPNRMVMMKGGYWHRISLVKSNAATPRCSIAGFMFNQ